MNASNQNTNNNWSGDLCLDDLRLLYSNIGARILIFKILSPNDNSKNQVYLGLGFGAINIIPHSELIESLSVSTRYKTETTILKGKLDFAWANKHGRLFNAPEAQLILYPQYPEVRFSGFLKGAIKRPASEMNSRDEGRILFLGITEENKIIGFVSSKQSKLSKEIHSRITEFSSNGVFHEINLKSVDTKTELLAKLAEIHSRIWINSIRLDKHGNTIDCNAPQCGGYTLEALFGIIPNGVAEPDFKDWELKSFSVASFDRLDSSIVTLMTPEPDGGIYKEKGVAEFINQYGYPDKNGIPDRFNFGGIHKVGELHPTTKLTLYLPDFNVSNGKINDLKKGLSLIDNSGTIAASWSYLNLLRHWKKKHSKSAFIPSIGRKEPKRQYKYGSSVLLGEETDFIEFLRAFYCGAIYYDPGIKIENISTKPKAKKRNQFRVKTRDISFLYRRFEEIDLKNY